MMFIQQSMGFLRVQIAVAAARCNRVGAARDVIYFWQEENNRKMKLTVKFINTQIPIHFPKSGVDLRHQQSTLILSPL